MDQRKLVDIIKQFPALWNRTHPNYRDKDSKENVWSIVGSKMGWSGQSCKDAFKAIREKYIREREKSTQFTESYGEDKWDLLLDLKFLDPNILPRKVSIRNETDIHKVDAFCSQINRETTPSTMSQTEVDKALIAFVKKTTPIWDRNCNTYPNKLLKNQLWDSIAAKLNLETNACMLRWKALREKYIRQRIKFQHEGEKWELLDELSFLDKVIQYRKKQTDDIHYQTVTNATENHQNNFSSQSATPHLHESDNNSTKIPYTYETGDDSSLNESSNDFSVNVKGESTVIEVADSSYYSSVPRKRATSTNSEAPLEKKQKSDNIQISKSPEDLFGELVAAMLARKPEKERNSYMIEIMTVLSK